MTEEIVASMLDADTNLMLATPTELLPIAVLREMPLVTERFETESESGEAEVDECSSVARVNEGPLSLREQGMSKV